MKCYKLTDRNGQTQNNTQWGEGVRHTATGTGTGLCSDGFIHAYESPEMAAFMNPIHGNFPSPIMWEADGEGEPVREGQLKCGFKALATVRAVPMVEITTEQRVEIALRCAMVNCKSKPWLAWAEKWLANDDRSGRAAAEAAWAAEAAEAAAEAAWAAAWAARAAAEAAARAAAWAAAEAGIDVMKIIKDVLAKGEQ